VQLDVLDPEFQGHMTDFVSWCWDYKVTDVLSSLHGWDQRRTTIKRQRSVAQLEITSQSSKSFSNDTGMMPSDDHYLWMCFFCNNQRKYLLEKSDQATTSEDLENIFEARLDLIGKNGCVIAVLDCYKHPIYTTRVWCVYEVFKSASAGRKIDVVFPKRVNDELGAKIEVAKFEEIASCVETIDTEHAQASSEQDAQRIKELIRNSVGYTAINNYVKSSLYESVAGVFTDLLCRAHGDASKWLSPTVSRTSSEESMHVPQTEVSRV